MGALSEPEDGAVVIVLLEKLYFRGYLMTLNRPIDFSLKCISVHFLNGEQYIFST